MQIVYLNFSDKVSIDSSPGYGLSVVHKHVTFLCLSTGRWWISLARGVFYSYARMSVFICLLNALRLSSSCSGKTHVSKRSWSARPATTTIASDIRIYSHGTGARGTRNARFSEYVCAGVCLYYYIAWHCLPSPVRLSSGMFPLRTAIITLHT